MMKFLEEARAYQDSMIQDLRELIKIESVRDDAHATKEAPFGPNIAKCLDKALEIGKRDGFQVENVDGHAGVIQYGDLEESVGVLGHLDVVVDKPLDKDYFTKFLLANELTGECHEEADGAHYHIDGKPFHASRPFMGINAAVKLPSLTVAKESRAHKWRNYAIYELLFSFLNSSNISTFSLRLKSFLFLFEIQSRNPF